MGKLTWLDRCAVEIAFVSVIGRIPKAPGTFGSIPGLIVGSFVHSLSKNFIYFGDLGPTIAVAMLLLILAGGAFWSIHRTEKALGIHDDSRIVIDEVCGQAIAVAFFPPNLTVIALGFVLFRFFDILKPGPIGYCDRHLPGAFGTLVDDLLAGVVVALILVWLPFV